jgi:hypothetical protein
MPSFTPEIGEVKKLNLIGYSPWEPERILEAIKKGASVSNIPGDFVFIAEGQGVTLLASSVVSALPYFYCQTPDGEALAHAETVFDCCRLAGIKWEWNERALNCLAVLEHTLGNDTLHRRVKRVPPGAVIEFRAGKLRAHQGDLLGEVASGKHAEGGFLHAVETLERVVGEMSREGKVAISLSAGYDSRVLLALAGKLGIRPIVGTMGRSCSTDVKVAAAIARQLSLEHRVVEIQPADYLRYAKQIVRITSGTKTANHWHTYIFTRHVEFPRDHVHLVGSNGEFVRSYYFDKGVLSLLAEAAPFDLVRPLLKLKYAPKRRMPVKAGRTLLPEKCEGSFDTIPDYISSLTGTASTFGQRLDRLYSLHRVRHFIGNGLALYNSIIRTLSPFLDTRFVAAGAALPRRLKLNGRFHAKLINHISPQLTSFPVDDTGRAMSERGRPFYWLRKRPSVGYSTFSDALELETVREIISESPRLDQFMERRSRQEAYGRKHQSLLAVLITLHFTCELIADQGL